MVVVMVLPFIVVSGLFSGNSKNSRILSLGEESRAKGVDWRCDAYSVILLPCSLASSSDEFLHGRFVDSEEHAKCSVGTS